MQKLLLSSGIRFSEGLFLVLASYEWVIKMNFSFLFIGNVMLLLGIWAFLEGFILFISAFASKNREKRKRVLGTLRATFIVIFMADTAIRLTGVMNIYSENADGNYFSLAQQEKLNSWYWVHPPNTRLTNQKKEFLFDRKVNSLGLSEKEVKKEKGDKVRILAIGDSFTEGVGTSYQDSWVKQMEIRWERQHVETINAGIGGSDPIYEFALYRDKLTEFKPDVVIVTMNASDITDVSSRGGFERFHKDGTAGKEPPVWEWVYASNHLFRMILHRLFDYDTNLVKGTTSDASMKKAVRDIQEALGKFQQLTQKEGAELLIVIHPAIQNFEDGKYTPFFGQVELAHYLESHEIEYIDVSKTFEAKGTKVGDYYYPMDTHFNKKGYALFGNAVYEKVEEMDVLK